jgi:metallo-beta-lactamase family protein
MATVTFHGAAQEVTGSCYLLESPACGRVLLECGMHQGGDSIERVTREAFDFDPASIDAVILSHGHLDHSGLLPKLVKSGFSGPIYCTQATRSIVRILLKDAVGLYIRDLERENLRRERSGRELLAPEYTEADVERVMEQCQGVPYNHSQVFGNGARVCFYDAGHILGSAIVEITLEETGRSKRLVFSGDLGRAGSVLMNNPVKLTEADMVLMEGTYGDRDHRDSSETIAQLVDILGDTWQRGGNVLIPAFALGRSQEIIFHLGKLWKHGLLDNWQVYLDSPMAIEITQVYDRWLHIMDDSDVRQLDQAGRDSLAGFIPQMKLCRTPEESMAINRIRQGAIIIAGSGMCTGGRIRHHFKHRIWRENTTILFIGFQARGTLGRMLVEGMKNIKLFGDEFLVRARIETLGGFSAHAGQTELVEWISHFEPTPQVALVHGEAHALEALAQRLWTEKRIRAEIPAQGKVIAF